MPPLAAVLEKNPVGSRGNTLAFEILSHIGPVAQKAVLKWLQTTDASAAPLATQWVILSWCPVGNIGYSI